MRREAAVVAVTIGTSGLSSRPAHAHGGSLADGILFALLAIGLAVVVALGLLAVTARRLLRARRVGLTHTGRRQLRRLGGVDVALAATCVPLFFVTGGGGDSWKLVWPGLAFLTLGVAALRFARTAKEHDIAG